MKRLFTLLALSLAAPAAHADVQSAVKTVFSADTTYARDAAISELDLARESDPLAAYAAGAGYFFQALEGLAQSLYLHGFESPRSFMLPLMRMPIPENPSPEPLTYIGLRKIFADFHDQLALASDRLAMVPRDADIGVEADLAKVGIDLDRDGKITKMESLAAIMASINSMGAMPPESSLEGLVFRFDRADGFWLDGYSHVLMAQANFWLAHDFSQAFNQSFHVLFPRAGLPMQNELVPLGEEQGSIFASEWRIADLVSFIHLINWPVAEPERRKQVRHDLLAVVALSRQNWISILSEKDNDREWLPGPHQPGQHALTGLAVTENEVAAWHDALKMLEDLLEGRKLLPHFRFADRGVDMKKFFEEPTNFDLVLSITGPAIVPYLRQGPMLSSDEFWAMTSRFESFMSFAIWFN
jgi:hypothetical protein